MVQVACADLQNRARILQGRGLPPVRTAREDLCRGGSGFRRGESMGVHACNSAVHIGAAQGNRKVSRIWTDTHRE